jgi:hypothetical protein
MCNLMMLPIGFLFLCLKKKDHYAVRFLSSFFVIIKSFESCLIDLFT